MCHYYDTLSHMQTHTHAHTHEGVEGVRVRIRYTHMHTHIISSLSPLGSPGDPWPSERHAHLPIGLPHCSPVQTQRAEPLTHVSVIMLYVVIKLSPCVFHRMTAPQPTPPGTAPILLPPSG
ncbi:unnamed protein product [Gadus morhua 'NCC']